MSTDSITEKFKNPLPPIGGFIKTMWSSKEPLVFEISRIFEDLDEVEDEEQNELVEDIKTDMAEVEKVIEEQASSVESVFDFDQLTINEIIEKLRCKCQTYKDKFMKKYDHISITSKKSKFSKYLYDTSQEEDKIDCKEFLSIKDYATYFIDNILEEATAKASDTLFGEVEPSVADEFERNYDEIDETSVSNSNISNLIIGNFSPKLGKELILNIIHTWSLKKQWTYCIDFVQENSDSCADYYVYEVKWSLPTMSYPIPQISASVFFTINVSRIQTIHCPVTVSYIFETERYKFLPEDDVHHEVFLDNIMSTKLEIFRNLRI